MSKRTLRRAAERAARETERRTQLSIPQPIPTQAIKTLTATASTDNYPDLSDDRTTFPDTEPTSEARITANRNNARKSTGPLTSQGKATSSLNALKHGLTGNTVLIDSDDADAYQQRLDAHVEQFKPVTFEERRLVQSIHDAAWRLDRIVNLESAIYAKGRIELDFEFHDRPAERKSFIQLATTERYAKELRNLHIQESRLQRQRATDIKALTQLIQQRKAEALAEESVKTPPGRPVGFDFASPELYRPVSPNNPSEPRPNPNGSSE